MLGVLALNPSKEKASQYQFSYARLGVDVF